MQALMTVMCILSQAVVAFSSEPTTTQSVRSGRGPAVAAQSNDEPFVMRLMNANCIEVSNMLSTIFSDVAGFPVEQSNCIVFMGPPESQESVRRLVEKMDQLAADRDGPRVVIADIKHRRVEELVDRLSQMAVGRQLRVSGDRGRSKILLRGNADEIRQAEQLLEQLDTPAAAVAVEFAFIQAGAEANGTPIPSDLADVAKELERFGTLTMLGRLSTVAVEGDKFGIDGQVVPGVQAEVRGFVSSGSPEGTVKMEIKASLQLNSPVGSGGAPGGVPYFRLETSIASTRGQYLVVGMAPAGAHLGESVILVMYVRK